MQEYNFSTPDRKNSIDPKNAIRAMQSRVIQTSLLITGIIGVPALVVVFFRSTEFGWRNVNFFYFGAVAMAWLLVILGNKLPLIVRTAITLIALFLVGAATLYTVGLSSMALVWLTLFCLLAVIFVNTRTGLVALGLSLAAIIAVGLGVHFGHISFDTNLPVFFASRWTWLTTLLSFGMAGAILVSVLGRLQRFLINSMFRLSDQRQELQTANETIAESEEHFRTLVETSPVAIGVGDGELNLTHINEKFVELFGYTAEEIPTQQDWIEKAYPDEPYREQIKAQWTANIAKSVKNNVEMKPIEATVICKNGNRRTVEFRGSFIGERMVIACNDISKRIATENELRRLRNLLASIVDSMDSIIIGVDRDLRVTQWNKQAEAVTGNSAEQALAKPLGEVFPRIASEIGWVKEAIEFGKRNAQTKVPIPMGKEIRYWNVMNYPIFEEQLEGAVIRIDDVTEQVHLEEMMVQSEKMMSVGQLAAGMAHEINNPLAGVLQNAEVLKVRLTERLPKNQQAAEECGISMNDIVCFGHKRGIPQALERLVESGTRAAKIVENMLSFARRSESVKVPRDLRVLLDATVELCKTDYDFKRQYDFMNIEIQKEYEDDIPLVSCEPTEIQQVFLNVLKNGAEAMNLVGSMEPPPMDKPTLSSNPPAFVLRIKRRGKMVRVEIEDNGPGMDKDIRKRIFEPFFTSKQVGVGTGLGLSVSYFIVNNNHDGNLSVESIEGKGSTFIIDLPVT